MDLSRVVVCLTYLITLDFNSAESEDSDTTLQDVAVLDETTSYIPARFTWAYSNRAPRTTLITDRRGLVSTDTDDDDLDPQARALYWIPTTCDSLVERGYTCVACGESLHCMGSNFALKAICYGRRPYCYNGVCSYIPGEKCQKEGQTNYTAGPLVQASQQTPIADPAIQADVLPANASL